MAKITNLDKLKRIHDRARIAKVGSKEWIEFATTMIDSFPALYETARAMNTRMDRLQNQVSVATRIVNDGVSLMTTEQVGKWRGVRSFLEQETDDYEPLEVSNVELRGCALLRSPA